MFIVQVEVASVPAKPPGQGNASWSAPFLRIVSIGTVPSGTSQPVITIGTGWRVLIVMSGKLDGFSVAAWPRMLVTWIEGGGAGSASELFRLWQLLCDFHCLTTSEEYYYQFINW